MSDVMPPDKVFLKIRRPLVEMRGAETLYGFKEFNFPDKGFLAYYHNRPQPNKGMVYTEAMEANNILKKVSIGTVMMFRPKRRWLNNILLQFSRLADYLYDPHYLHLRYYNECSQELFEFTYRFLRYLGIGFELSFSMGRIIATLLQYENAYRFRVEDVFTATTKEKLLADPRKELKRLEKLYLERETYIGAESAEDKFKAVFKGLRFILLIPKVKKAFKFALIDSEFKNFQLDEIDTYWAHRFREYHFGGIPYAIRQLKQGFKILC